MTVDAFISDFILLSILMIEFRAIWRNESGACGYLALPPRLGAERPT